MLSIGIVIILITLFGYLSNMLNWRYLNYKIVRFLYYIGALVHETSHAVVCILTGAKIEEFVVFADQPRVVHRKSKLPIVGEFLISIAPIAGGFLFLFLIDHYFLGNHLFFLQGADFYNIKNTVRALGGFLLQFNLLQWQSWVMLFLLLNVGAMLGPSTRDLKNAWPVLIVLLFIKIPFLAGLGLAALGLILANIVLQLILILCLFIIGFRR